MKIAVAGKGGVGKTTIAAGLARVWRTAGRSVTAVDADPNPTLAEMLGHRGPRIVPLSSLRRLIEERVGGGEGAWAGFLKMNPRVDDIPAQVGVDVGGVRVLVMGGITRGRGGCVCPESVLLREVLGQLVLREREHVVVDLEAGLEHLGRGTAEGVDAMLVVVEPGWASLRTFERVRELAADLGLTRVHAVANKIAGDEDRRLVAEALGAPPLAALPLDPLLEADARAGRHDAARAFHRELGRLAALLEESR